MFDLAIILRLERPPDEQALLDELDPRMRRAADGFAEELRATTGLEVVRASTSSRAAAGHYPVSGPRWPDARPGAIMHLPPIDLGQAIYIGGALLNLATLAAIAKKVYDIDKKLRKDVPGPVVEIHSRNGDMIETSTTSVAEAEQRLAAAALCVIMFTDMEGSTALTQRLRDAKAQEVLRTHNAIIRDALESHGGSEIKHTGDGIMASFDSISRALQCAIDIQRAFAQHNETTKEPIRVRIGLNAGEPIREEGDLFGAAVQMAAYLCKHAKPGQILTWALVKELAAGKDFLFSDRGDLLSEDFDRCDQLYEVRWEE